MGNKLSKNSRQLQLKECLERDPFLTDDALAAQFGVSVPTVRLDRLELQIPELKERMKDAAQGNLHKLTAIAGNEFIGELMDIEPGSRAIALLRTEPQMVFSKTQIVRGHYIYSFAESLAIAVTDAKAALVEVANIKYMRPIFAGEKLVGIAELKARRDKNSIVWVKIKENGTPVFRGKFILAEIQECVTEGGRL